MRFEEIQKYVDSLHLGELSALVGYASCELQRKLAVHEWPDEEAFDHDRRNPAPPSYEGEPLEPLPTVRAVWTAQATEDGRMSSAKFFNQVAPDMPSLAAFFHTDGSGIYLTSGDERRVPVGSLAVELLPEGEPDAPRIVCRIIRVTPTGQWLPVSKDYTTTGGEMSAAEVHESWHALISDAERLIEEW